MSHLTSAWFTVLVFGFTCSDLSFLQKKILLYIKKKEISDKPSFQDWALFPFYKGVKSDRKPHSWVVHFPVTIHHHCKQQTNPAKFFPVLFLPLARKHLWTQTDLCEQFYFAISALSQCQEPKGKGHFWGRRCHWWGILCRKHRGFGQAKGYQWWNYYYYTCGKSAERALKIHSMMWITQN